MASNWQIGDKIENRWEIHKILRGGMGIVYIVYDHELHAPYAAKTYQDKIFASSPKIADRFTQEALTWVNLDIHQNVTQARFANTIQGKPYLFLEYVSGGDLSGWTGTPRLIKDLPQVLRFAIQFCDGMIHAASKGIKVHRDIKPQNCLVTEDRTLKVTDFGLAKVFEDVSSLQKDDRVPNEQLLEISRTQTGTGAGTPPYMAPEQFEDIKHVDVKADIYAFGVMLYQMVTGRLPFVARTMEDYIRLHKEQLPMTDHIEPESLREIIETCLIKDPTLRFSDFTKLRKELVDIYEKLTKKPTPQPVEGLKLDAIQLSDKGFSLQNLGRPEETLTCYDQALELDPQLEPAWSNKGVALTNLGRFDEAFACFDRALELNPRLEQAWTNRGMALGHLGRPKEALTCHDQALELNPRFVEAWTNKGNVLLNLGRPEEALICYDQALELNPRLELVWYNKGGALADMGRPEEALSCYDQALKLNPRYEQAWYNKGGALFDLGSPEEALTCYDQALELNPRDEQVWYNKAAVLMNLGCNQEALANYNQALELNPRLEEAWYNKGATLAILGHFEEALACYDQALKLNPRLADAWILKGVGLVKLNRFEEALFCFEQAQQLGMTQAAGAIDWCRKQLGQR